MASQRERARLRGEEFRNNRELALRRDLFSCQARRLDLPGRCQGDVQVHHVLPRGRGGPNDLDNLLCLCLVHHAWAHANPIEAREKGALR